MTRDSSSGATDRPRDTYDPKVVDRVFGAIEWLNEHHLANVLYYTAAVCMIPPYLGLTNLLNDMRVHGKERLPPRGTGFFLLSNHISMLDGQMLSTVTFPRTYWFPSKAAFYTSNLRGLGYTLATGCKAFPVRRGERDTRAVEFINDLLSRGDSVLLFPEGTRSKDGTLGQGKIGVGRIVHDARPVIVPAYVEGFDRILRPGKWTPGIGQEAHIVFGEPLPMDDLFALPRERETFVAIVDRVMEAIAGLREELHAG